MESVRERRRTFFRLSLAEWAARLQSCAVRRGDAKQRLDPHFHAPIFRDLIARIASRPHLPLGRVVAKSDETWDQQASPDSGADTFRYLEISAVGLGTGEYRFENVLVSDAPSRARMFLRGGDIVVSTTRPHRGAIAEIQQADEGGIGSTGFAVLREQRTDHVRRDFLRNVLFSDAVLLQFLQRSSGGAYPAITPDEMDRVLIPIADDDLQKRLVATLDTARAHRKKKEAEADTLLTSLDGFLLATLGLTPPPKDDRTVFATTLTEARRQFHLNADYFHPERVLALRAIEAARRRIPCVKLEEVVSFIRDQIKTPGSNYLSLAHVQSNTGELVNADEEAAGACSEFQTGDVLFARLRPYLNKVYRAEMDGCCSPEFHVLRVVDAQELLPDYLAAILRSNLTLAQTRHMMTGNTHPRLTNEDVISLVIPIPKDVDVQKTIAVEARRRREEARRLRAEAEDGWQATKRWFEEQLLGAAQR